MAVKKVKKIISGFSALSKAQQQVTEKVPLRERQDWKRKNYRGNEVDLIGGVGLAYLLTRSSLISGVSFLEGVAQSLAIGGAATLGYIDDTREARTARQSQKNIANNTGQTVTDREQVKEGKQGIQTVNKVPFDSSQAKYKGLKGHWQSVRQGEISTGVWKVVGIGAGAAGAALLLQIDTKTRKRKIEALSQTLSELALAAPSAKTHRLIKRNNSRLKRLKKGAIREQYSLIDWGLDSGIIAGFANLINLFDLRPGRALKISTLLCTPLLFAKNSEKNLARRITFLNLLALPMDLQEKTMLGDTGANALGAGLGTAWAMRLSQKKHKVLLFLTLVGLTLLSEKVSFSKVIEKNPLLRALDEMGRA